VQTTPQRSTRARKPSAAKLPYPELPNDHGPRFYIAWHQIKLAELDEVRKHWPAQQRKKRRNEPLVMALVGLEMDLENEVKESSLRLRKEGLLPFAWQGTTYLQQVAA
jgi:hypothetical protein